jgi:diacylglycerol O-acyltransferase / wax synthase
VTERLSAADAAVLSFEGPTTPQHVGGLAIFDPPADGFDYDRLLGLLEERIALAPRYRQKVRPVPGHLANPVWVDDADFDISYHVRRSVLPRPGSAEQLVEFCARIQTRRLDRARPLWEMYLVEGMADGRVAIVTKTHQAMVDGLAAIDLAEVILDGTPHPTTGEQSLWMPEPEPSVGELVVGALVEAVRRPATAVETARHELGDLGSGLARAAGLVTGAARTAVAAVRSQRPSPLSAQPGEQRRLVLVRTGLDDYRLVRAASDTTINDVALATVAGALRGWLFRGEPVRPSTTVRVLVPVSVDDPAGTRVVGLVVELPVGEADPLLRLARVSYALATHLASGRSIRADALVALGGFAPPTLHALGARAAGSLRQRMFSLVVANVPGPQQPRFAAGARLAEMYPILPLGRGEALSIGLTSYDGGLFYGINADADAVPDASVLAGLVEESLAELVAASAVSAAVPAARQGAAGRSPVASGRPSGEGRRS